MHFSASAPGKAVLAGEYAVLQGAPAIAMAVDCRARVTIESNDADWHSAVSPGQCGGTSKFRCTERGTIEWLEDGGAPGDQELLEQVWHQVKAMPAQSLKLTLDTRRFYDTESNLKLGFGSSSALATALTAALVRAGAAKCAANGAANGPSDMLDLATAAHRNFQNGQGSGIDVATAVHGGVIAFTLRGEQRVQTLRWPAGLDFWLLWSGRPASTVDRLSKLQRFRQNPAARDSAGKLVEASREVHDAWQQGAQNRILDSLRSYTSALKRFGEEHALGIFDAGHQELAELAAARQLIYKPSGAGGGDVGILFIPRDTRDETLSGFKEEARQLGFRRLDRSLESAGLNYEH